MVALDAGQSEIASMLYSRMNIKCSVSVNPGGAGGGGLWDGDRWLRRAGAGWGPRSLNLPGVPVRK